VQRGAAPLPYPGGSRYRLHQVHERGPAGPGARDTRGPAFGGEPDPVGTRPDLRHLHQHAVHRRAARVVRGRGGRRAPGPGDTAGTRAGPGGVSPRGDPARRRWRRRACPRGGVGDPGPRARTRLGQRPHRRQRAAGADTRHLGGATRPGTGRSLIVSASAALPARSAPAGTARHRPLPAACRAVWTAPRRWSRAPGALPGRARSCRAR
jgi:hypothetical protein